MNLKLIASGFNHPLLVQALVKTVETHAPQALTCIGYNWDNNLPLFTKLKDFHFLDFSKVNAGVYPESWVSDEAFDPFIFERLHSVQTQSLKMVERAFPFSTYDFRKALFNQHVQFWYRFLKKEKINCYMVNSSPHEVYDYILYHLCRELQIKVIILSNITPFKNRYFVFNSVFESYQKIKKEYLRLINTPNEPNISPEVDKVFDNLVNKIEDPFYIQQSRKSSQSQLKTLNLLQKTLKHFFLLLQTKKDRKFYFNKLIWRFYRRVILLFRTNSIQRFYYQIQSTPDYQANYIYVPLHFQPENSTNPLGGVFTEQELMIQMLSDCLPPDWFLYVKEHPVISNNRTRYFYQRFKTRKNIKFISQSESSHSLIQHCKAVGTVTGTAGWEALHKGKPVLVFGYVYYMDAEGAFFIDSMEKLQSTMNKIKNGVINHDHLTRLRVFQQALHNVTARGWVNEAYQLVAEITDQENVTNLVGQLSQELSSF